MFALTRCWKQVNFLIRTVYVYVLVKLWTVKRSIYAYNLELRRHRKAYLILGQKMPFELLFIYQRLFSPCPRIFAEFFNFAVVGRNLKAKSRVYHGRHLSMACWRFPSKQCSYSKTCRRCCLSWISSACFGAAACLQVYRASNCPVFEDCSDLCLILDTDEGASDAPISSRMTWTQGFDPALYWRCVRAALCSDAHKL